MHLRVLRVHEADIRRPELAGHRAVQREIGLARNVPVLQPRIRPNLTEPDVGDECAGDFGNGGDVLKAVKLQIIGVFCSG